MKGYDKIGNFGQIVFDKVHKQHLASMGAEMKKQYERDQVKSVKANNVESCIEVRFLNGDLFKYLPNGTWY
ncbi:hypothetical protein [Halalkalibacterium ligniniphilum]|uniref:hypothetical protein n=1 Tax=Halalkalibacterium ligniniphilum TaxID=1134413 RepID=UPI0003476F3B|nr:hypothetical protein [Halalkalibacterium ligniniphilum]